MANAPAPTPTFPSSVVTGDRWIVRLAFATRHDPENAAMIAMADLADRNHDATIARRGDGPGFTFTVEVSSNAVSFVAYWAIQIAEDVAGYGIAADLTLVDLRVCTPEVYGVDEAAEQAAK